MRCTVYNKKRRTVVLAIFLALLSAALMCAPYVLRSLGVEKHELTLRALGVVAISVLIYIVMRHIALSFVYAIVPRDAGGLDFTVARLRGERVRTIECVLSLTDLVFAGSNVTKRSLRKRFEGAPIKYYDYSVTSGLEDLVLVFEDGDGYVAIITEPSDEMREYLTSYAARTNDFLKGSDS